jgi:hypothetical protein
LGERRASTLKEARTSEVNTIFMVNAMVFSLERSGIMRTRKLKLFYAIPARLLVSKRRFRIEDSRKIHLRGRGI